MLDWGFDLPADAFADIDADGIADAHDATVDTDHDFIDDRADPSVDSDGDFLSDSVDSMVDRDHDWIDDRQDSVIDVNGDGVKDGILTHLPHDPFLQFAPDKGMRVSDLSDLVDRFGLPSPFAT